MKIVHRYVAISGAAGFITVPVLDAVALGAVHIALIKEITEYYKEEFSEHVVRNVLIAMAASLIPGSIGSIVVRRMLRALPMIPTGVGLVGMAAGSAVLSYGIGRVFVAHFERGGKLDSFDVKQFIRLLNTPA